MTLRAPDALNPEYRHRPRIYLGVATDLPFAGDLATLGRSVGESGVQGLWLSERWGRDALAMAHELAPGLSHESELGFGVLQTFRRTPLKLVLGLVPLLQNFRGPITIGIGAGSPQLASAAGAQICSRPQETRDYARSIASLIGTFHLDTRRASVIIAGLGPKAVGVAAHFSGSVICAMVAPGEMANRWRHPSLARRICLVPFVSIDDDKVRRRCRMVLATYIAAWPGATSPHLAALQTEDPSELRRISKAAIDGDVLGIARAISDSTIHSRFAIGTSGLSRLVSGWTAVGATDVIVAVGSIRDVADVSTWIADADASDLSPTAAAATD